MQQIHKTHPMPSSHLITTFLPHGAFGLILFLCQTLDQCPNQINFSFPIDSILGSLTNLLLFSLFLEFLKCRVLF